MNMVEQANLCLLLTQRLAESVKDRGELTESKRRAGAGYGFAASTGVGMYQIKSDITRLRRELQLLSEIVSGYGYERKLAWEETEGG